MNSAISDMPHSRRLREMRPWSALRYGDLGSRDYFSVFRDPLQSMNNWKQQLSSTERAKIISVVRDSMVFQAGVRAAHWED